MKGFYMQSERARESWKDGKESEVNVYCIVDQDHQIWAIAVDHSSKFKDIYYWILWIYLATHQDCVKDTH